MRQNAFLTNRNATKSFKCLYGERALARLSARSSISLLGRIASHYYAPWKRVKMVSTLKSVSGGWYRSFLEARARLQVTKRHPPLPNLKVGFPTKHGHFSSKEMHILKVRFCRIKFMRFRDEPRYLHTKSAYIPFGNLSTSQINKKASTALRLRTSLAQYSDFTQARAHAPNLLTTLQDQLCHRVDAVSSSRIRQLYWFIGVAYLAMHGKVGLFLPNSLLKKRKKRRGIARTPTIN